jgi:hypothetical protein
VFHLDLPIQQLLAATSCVIVSACESGCENIAGIAMAARRQSQDNDS